MGVSDAFLLHNVRIVLWEKYFQEMMCVCVHQNATDMQKNFIWKEAKDRCYEIPLIKGASIFRHIKNSSFISFQENAIMHHTAENLISKKL